uniref:phosphopyruvate hydratase n=1 Tax=Fundulus heteroclitus TaxID=8078 RepID=A0A3Q2PGM1_FUNHE
MSLDCPRTFSTVSRCVLDLASASKGQAQILLVPLLGYSATLRIQERLVALKQYSTILTLGHTASNVSLFLAEVPVKDVSHTGDTCFSNKSLKSLSLCLAEFRVQIMVKDFNPFVVKKVVENVRLYLGLLVPYVLPFYLTGKTSNIDAKPLSPTRPLEPVLHESMAMSSVSLAVAKSGAKIKGVPLYKYISALKSQKELQQFHVPVPWITLIKCGKKSAGKLCLLEEVILISKVKQPVKQSITMAFELQKEMMRMINISTKTGVAQASVLHSGGPTASYDRPEQPLDLITDACSNLNVLLGTDVYLALNCAAPKLVDYSKGKYEVATGVLKSPDELVELYQNLISKYPAVVALIDPFRREDAEQWEKLSNTTGNACSLLSDITHKPLAPVLPGVRGYVLGHVNETTVSDIIHATLHYQGTRWEYAVGLGFDYVKFGGLSGGETMAKYNRLISIEEELAQQGLLGDKYFIIHNFFEMQPGTPEAEYVCE